MTAKSAPYLGNVGYKKGIISVIGEVSHEREIPIEQILLEISRPKQCFSIKEHIDVDLLPPSWIGGVI